MRIVVTGEYGGNNLGDEALLCSLTYAWREVLGPSVSITALSRDPVATSQKYGIDALRNPTFSAALIRDLLAVDRAIRKADYVIVGGGSLLHDDLKYIKVIPRYLLPALIGAARGKRVIWWALGAGPVRSRYSKKLITMIGRLVDRLTVRDNESKLLLEGLGLSGIDVVPDPVVLLPELPQEIVRRTLEKIGLPFDGKPQVAIFLRDQYRDPSSQSLHRLTEAHEKLLVSQLNRVATRLHARLVFCCAATTDREITERVAAGCGGETIVLTKSYHPETYASILSRMDALISIPLHPAVIATGQGKPVVVVAYDFKLRHFMRRIGLEDHVLSVNELEQLADSVERAWDDRDTIGKQAHRAYDEMRTECWTMSRSILETRASAGAGRACRAAAAAMFMVFGYLSTYLIHTLVKTRE